MALTPPLAKQLPRVGFIMTTEVGLGTQYLNWRNGLTEASGIDPEWIAIHYWRENGLLERLPLLPKAVKTRLRAQLEMREGLAKGPFDALFIAGNMIHGLHDALREQPYFITVDTTPIQLHSFGDLYGKQASRFALYEQRKHAGRRLRYQQAAALFPWSHWAAQSMIADYGADPARVHVIPPGIDLAQWRSPERDPNATPVKILFVGGHFHRKGGDLLLEWAKQTALRDWELHLVTRDAVQTDDPRVHVYNNLSANAPQLRQLYRDAHLFALPTRGDCYSLASMEAMASGLPVILCRTGGTGDIIQDGETGFLVEPNDAVTLGERLDYLLTHPRERVAMGRAALADAQARYDVHQNIQQIVDIMRAAIARGASRPNNIL